ncbi:MAG TPA: hypothetical protein PKY38_03890 [Opitutaceae bacterium]|nr:hypothetical protein [Opitutaceae bacterium]
MNVAATSSPSINESAACASINVLGSGFDNDVFTPITNLIGTYRIEL